MHSTCELVRAMSRIYDTIIYETCIIKIYGILLLA